MHNIASPRTDDSAIEQMLQAKGLNAPRVTPQDIERNIISEHYFTARDGVAGRAYVEGVYMNSIPESLSLLTFCVLVLRNGFTVTGESACVSPELFDAGVGKTVARSNAINKVWSLMGYVLKEHLMNQQES